MKKNLIFKALTGILFVIMMAIGGQIIHKQNEKINELYEQIERQQSIIMSMESNVINANKR